MGWTLLVDTFNNEILAHQATPIQGSAKPYYYCLEHLKLLAGEKNEEHLGWEDAADTRYCEHPKILSVFRGFS